MGKSTAPSSIESSLLGASSRLPRCSCSALLPGIAASSRRAGEQHHPRNPILPFRGGVLRPAILAGCLAGIALLPLACRNVRAATPSGSAAAGHTTPPVVREILALATFDSVPALRLRSRLELLDGEVESLACAEFLRSAAPVEDRVRVIEFLDGGSWPALVDALVEGVGSETTPKPLVLACHRALCSLSFFRVELNPDLHYEARRALVARDWARWWVDHRQISPSDRLASRLSGALESERLEIIRALSRVGDPAAVPTLVRFVDSGTLEFRARALMTISYLTNTVFLEQEAISIDDQAHPQEIRLLDAVTRCQEWWRTASDRSPEDWIREGFRARGYGLHTPPVAADLDTLVRALEDRHPAIRSQALRHLVRWTGQVIVEEPSVGLPAFRSMAAQWRDWIQVQGDRLQWNPDVDRFGLGAERAPQ